MAAVHYGQFLDASDPDQAADDVWTIAATPAEIRNGSFRLHYIPKEASSYASARFLLSVNSSPTLDFKVYRTGGVAYIAVAVAGSVVVQREIVFAALQPLQFIFDAAAGTVSVSGAGSGDGESTGTAWSVGAGAMRLGGLYSGGSMARGYVSLPYAIAGTGGGGSGGSFLVDGPGGPGITDGPGGPLLVDGPSHPLEGVRSPRFAVWMSKLLSGYPGQALRVGSGVPDFDVPFSDDTGGLYVPALSACSGNGFVKKLYSQVGGFSADNVSGGPQIWDGSALLPELSDTGAPTMLFAGVPLTRPDAFGFSGDPAITLAWKGKVTVPNPDGSSVLDLGTFANPELTAYISMPGVDAYDFVSWTDNGDPVSVGASWHFPIGEGGQSHSYVLQKPAGTGYATATWKLYIDGVDQGPPTQSGAPYPLNISNTWSQIGADSGYPEGEYAGQLNGVIAWDVFLTPTELALVHNFLSLPWS